MATGKPAWMKTIEEWVPPQLSRTQSKPPAERFTIFTVDDEEYTAPVEVPPVLVLRVLQAMAQQGMAFAVLELMAGTIGQGALDALCEVPDLERDQLKEILYKLQTHYLGQIQDITNSGN